MAWRRKKKAQAPPAEQPPAGQQQPAQAAAPTGVQAQAEKLRQQQPPRRQQQPPPAGPREYEVAPGVTVSEGGCMGTTYTYTEPRPKGSQVGPDAPGWTRLEGFLGSLRGRR
jgi:hypothetical protein